MDYLQNGVPARYNVNGEERSAIVYLADYDNIQNNSFIAANQWTFIEHSNRRTEWVQGGALPGYGAKPCVF